MPPQVRPGIDKIDKHPPKTAARTYLEHAGWPPFLSPTSPTDATTSGLYARGRMRDENLIRERLEQLRGQLLQWGTPDLMVFTTTKDELRGWIRALEWILAETGEDSGRF